MRDSVDKVSKYKSQCISAVCCNCAGSPQPLPSRLPEGFAALERPDQAAETSRDIHRQTLSALLPCFLDDPAWPRPQSTEYPGSLLIRPPCSSGTGRTRRPIGRQRHRYWHRLSAKAHEGARRRNASCLTQLDWTVSACLALLLCYILRGTAGGRARMQSAEYVPCTRPRDSRL